MDNINAIEGLTINESDYDLQYGQKGRIAVIMYLGNADPKTILDYAVSQYVGENGYHELIDANLDNPWMRVIVSDINGMVQEKFKIGMHHMNKPLNR